MGTLTIGDKIDFLTLVLLRIVLAVFLVMLFIKYTGVSIDGTVSTFDLDVDVAKAGEYTILSDTELLCDTVTVYYMIKQMTADGYVLTVLSNSNMNLEFILENGECVHHILYTVTGKLTCISSPYEKSYIPLTYIYEKMYN